MADLTNSKPKDTYHRLVQVDSGSQNRFQRFQDGLGSPILSASFYSLEVANDIYVRSGSVYAQSFVTTYTTSSTLFQSGSTKFGDSLDDTHKFTGSLELTGSLRVTGSEVSFNLPWPSTGGEIHFVETQPFTVNFPGYPTRSYDYAAIALEHNEQYGGDYHHAFKTYMYSADVPNPDYGTENFVSAKRAGLRVIPSGSGVLGNISVEDNLDGTSQAKIYANTVQIGSYTGSTIAFGNTSTNTYFEGVNNILGSTIVYPNRLFTLRPSQTLGLTPETGSIVVSGSSIVYYDGNDWQYLQTGSYALSSSLNVATASINVNETNINALTSKTGSYALTSSLNVATASITVNETNINTLTAATSSYALDSEVEHINSVTSSFALSSALTVATSSITVNEANINNLTLFTGSYSSSASDTYVSIAKLKAIVTGSADFATFQTNILSL